MRWRRHPHHRRMPGCRFRQRGNNSGSVNLANVVAAPLGNIDIAAGIHSDSGRTAQLRKYGKAIIAVRSSRYLLLQSVGILSRRRSRVRVLSLPPS
jgi:hypothetical protein